MIVSANDLARTRTCRAHSCPDDAEHYSLFCGSHDRRHKAGVEIPLHVVPEPQGPVLLCGTCREWLPDEAFTPRKAGDPGYSANRRGRLSECRACHSRKRRERRANDPEYNAKQNAYRRARDAKRKRTT